MDIAIRSILRAWLDKRDTLTWSYLPDQPIAPWFKLILAEPWAQNESEREFQSRMRRQFQNELSAYCKRVKAQHGMGARAARSREDNERRDAEWTARYMAGVPAFELSHTLDEDAVLKAIRRFAARIGLTLMRSSTLPISLPSVQQKRAKISAKRQQAEGPVSPAVTTG